MKLGPSLVRERSSSGLFLSVFLVIGCGGAGSGEPLAAPTPVASVAEPRAREARYTKSARPEEPRYARALEAGEDPLELQRLGLDAGATELLEALDEGGRVAAIALGALPFAEDALLALGPLCDRALSVGAGASNSPRTGEALPTLEALLEVVRKLAQRGPEGRELADPDGVGRALAGLAKLAEDDGLPAETRALAADALQAIRGWR